MRITHKGQLAPKLLAGVAVGSENGNASHASRAAPARPAVTVSTWPPAIGDANNSVQQMPRRRRLRWCLPLDQGR